MTAVQYQDISSEPRIFFTGFEMSYPEAVKSQREGMRQTSIVKSLI